MLSFSSFFAVLLFFKWFIQSSEIHVIVLGTQWKKILLNQPKIILFYVILDLSPFCFLKFAAKMQSRMCCQRRRRKKTTFFISDYIQYTQSHRCFWMLEAILDAISVRASQVPTTIFEFFICTYFQRLQWRGRLACCMQSGNTWNFCSVFFVFSFF